jgi:hypothetical protein
LATVTAWVGAIVVFALGHLAMEGVMELHVKMMCAVRHVAAWDRDGTPIRAGNGVNESRVIRG